MMAVLPYVSPAGLRARLRDQEGPCKSSSPEDRPGN
jgi:hypothetical protein